MTFSDQDYPSIFTATCPYSWARARAYTHARSQHSPKNNRNGDSKPRPTPMPPCKKVANKEQSFWLGQNKSFAGLELKPFQSYSLPWALIRSLPRKKRLGTFHPASFWSLSTSHSFPPQFP